MNEQKPVLLPVQGEIESLLNRYVQTFITQLNTEMKTIQHEVESLADVLGKMEGNKR
jgi:ABC-type transporter Mla subunit MlaD